MEEFRVFESVEQLKKRTIELLRLCHAPYSNFRVTSIVLAQSKTDTGDRRVFNGVNVECASYPLCMCAERVAIYNAVSSGYTNTFSKLQLFVWTSALVKRDQRLSLTI